MHALHTDLYQLTMAAGYFHSGMASTVASCELFVRRLPPWRRYLVLAGVDQAIDYVHALRFDEPQLAFLRELPALREAMTPAFVDYLRDFRFRGELWAVPEGTVVFAGEPLLRVRAPIIEAQLLETFLLSTINHATMVASKAARIVRAAQDAQVIEFGTRRTHPHAAVDAARAAYLVGAVGTSNVEAGMRYGIRVMGTAAHMWVMAHDSEEQAFANYVKVFPGASILLIDTYDTVRGAERAARVAGDRLKGVRLDSGDLAALSRQVRAVLDAAGCRATRIVASGDLNEYSIRELRQAGAPIDIFGVGTELVASPDAPAIGGVYKVVQLEREGRVVPIAKYSEGKATHPGAHQVYRRLGADGIPAGDIVALADEPAPPGTVPLLETRIVAGAAVGEPSELGAAHEAARLGRAREHALSELDRLPAELHELEPGADLYPVRPSEPLVRLGAEVKARVMM